MSNIGKWAMITTNTERIFGILVEDSKLQFGILPLANGMSLTKFINKDTIIDIEIKE